MAELGGFSVWGAEDEDVGESSYKSSEPIPAPKRTSNLFDDLEEANADWSVQASPPIEEPSALSRRDRDSRQFATDLASSSAPTVDADLFTDAPETSSIDRIQDKLQSTTLDEANDDDFGDAEFAAAGDGIDDDDFGDFGTFEESQADSFAAAATAETSEIERAWRPLRIDKDTSLATLEADIREILAPPLPDGRMYPFHDGAASQLSQDKIRQVEGEAQVLVREESRNIWHSLTAQPNLKPVDWMRSSTRRQHLISLGIPINLDEVRMTDGAAMKTLAPVSISIDKKSADSNSKSPIQRGGTPDGRETKAPELDLARAKELSALTEDQLTLLALPALRDIARELDLLTRQASALLTHHLSQREAHNADAEMYNGLIRDLVTGAANRIGSTTGVKRSNTLRKASAATGGRNSPSPAPQPR